MQQGSVLSPLLFVMVLEALSQEFRTACPWELLYIDDLVIIDKSVEELCCTVTSWKINLENEGLRVKMKKTKVMFSGQNINMLLDSDMWPCGVCQSGMGSNSIFFSGVHLGAQNMPQNLWLENASFRCTR